MEKKRKKDTIIKKGTVSTVDGEEDCTPSWRIELEEVQKARTKEYNEKLIDNPMDVQLWLEYIEFQVCYTFIPYCLQLL